MEIRVHVGKRKTSVFIYPTLLMGSKESQGQNGGQLNLGLDKLFFTASFFIAYN